MIERKVQSKVIKHIKSIGGDAFKISAVTRRGCPDVLSIINGRIILIETKRTGKKKLDPLQEYFFLIWNDKKTNCIMVDSVENLKYKLNFIFDESH